MHVMTIDDDAAPAVRIFQRRADRAGLAALQRRHRVVQMREAADAGIESGTDLFVAAGGVSRAQQHAARDERADGIGRYAFRRQRHHGDAMAQRRHEFDLGLIGHAELPGVVRALARRRQIRAFQMQTENSRYSLGDRIAGRGDRIAHHLAIVADQGRQQTGGTEAPMRLRDAPQRIDGRRVVEQHAAAAVDLDVDEAGQQRVALQIVPRTRMRRHVRRITDPSDASIGDHHRQAADQSAPGQYAAVDQHAPAHTVSVTLLRCGGTSGSCPRRSANALIAR